MSHAKSGNGGRGEGEFRNVLNALFSAVIPGSGQLAAGARRRGVIMLGVVVALLIAAGVVFLQGVDQVLAWAIEPSVLLGLLIANALLLAFRLYAVMDAYRTRRAGAESGERSGAAAPSPAPGGGLDGRARRSTGRTVAVFALLCLVLVLTLAPHAVAGYYTYLSRDLLTTVFVSEDETTTSTTRTTAPADSTSTTLGAQSTSTATEAGPTATQTPPDTTPQIAGAEDQRITILFVGSDAGYGRTGSRADTIMVATFDLETGRIALFGIPRNTGDAPLSEVAAKALHKKVYVDLISSLYWEAREHPELAPEGRDAGATVLRDSVSMILGIPIDYYAVVDMGGFVKMVSRSGPRRPTLRHRASPLPRSGT